METTSSRWFICELIFSIIDIYRDLKSWKSFMVLENEKPSCFNIGLMKYGESQSMAKKLYNRLKTYAPDYCDEESEFISVLSKELETVSIINWFSCPSRDTQLRRCLVRSDVAIFFGDKSEDLVYIIPEILQPIKWGKKKKEYLLKAFESIFFYGKPHIGIDSMKKVPDSEEKSYIIVNIALCLTKNDGGYWARRLFELIPKENDREAQYKKLKGYVIDSWSLKEERLKNFLDAR